MDYDSSILNEVLKQLNTSRSIDIIKSASPALLAVSQHIEQHSKIIQSSILSQTGLKILNDVIPNATVSPSCFATAEHLSAAIAASLKASGFSDILESMPKLDPSVTSDEKVQSSDVLSNDDYVIIDEKPIKEWEIPDTLAIPIGHNKIRIKTEILVSLLLTIFFGLISFIQTEYYERKSSDSEQEYQKTKLLIEEERNQKFQDFLNSIDLSNSSQSTSINNLIRAIESLNNSLQDSEKIPQETDSIPYPIEEIHNKSHE